MSNASDRRSLAPRTLPGLGFPNLSIEFEWAKATENRVVKEGFLRHLRI